VRRRVKFVFAEIAERLAHDLAFALATIGHSSGGGSCQYQNLQPPPPRTHLIIRSFTMALMMPPNIPIPRWIPSRGIIESPMTTPIAMPPMRHPGRSDRLTTPPTRRPAI
jgi:hypothetical protein